MPVPVDPRDLNERRDSNADALKKVMQELDIHDPMFMNQWHLMNPVQPGHDINVTGVWRQNVTGTGSVVAIVDDGLDLDHKDLHDNFFAAGSYDFNDQTPLPRPMLNDDTHGTRCAGEIGAVRNDVCGVGIAYDGKVAGLRILSGRITEADEALSLNYAMDKNHIYSCSWGPPDDGRSIAEPGMLVRKAIVNGVLNGRDKKGSIFVFASGNGGGYGDNCNFDGYTNSIYSITVAAIDRRGMHPFYSEACSANMVVTYSSGSGDHIYTTDYHGQCTDNHGGTSAAAPIAAGIFALVLEVRPELTWRDMQYLSMDTAVPVNVEEPGWQKTHIGKMYNHKYGYGKLDAYAIVERAKTWELVKPQAWYFHERKTVHEPVLYGKAVSNTVEVTQEQLDKSNVGRLEHVTVFLNVAHQQRGVLEVELVSPSGIVSTLAAPRPNDLSNEGLMGWTFMSVVHWGESAAGNWTLKVSNDEKQGVEGVVLDWRLKLWGEAQDEKRSVVYPLPDEGDVDPDHDNSGYKQPEIPKPSSAPPKPSKVVFSSTAKPTQPSKPSNPPEIPSKPVANPEKPEKPEKPDETKTPTKTSSSAEATTTNAAATPSKTGGGSNPWSMIPTFGLSSHTLAWVYGSFLLIVLFVGGIVIYIFVSRRRRDGYSSKTMPSYEFDLIPAHDEDESDIDEEAVLYHRDEDDEVSSLGLSDDEEEYHDDDGGDDNDERMTSGKRARTLYDAYSAEQSRDSMYKDEHKEDGTQLFQVGDEDDDDTRDDITH
ncbi:kexin [Trichomonascus vanleenenianus]|uniref:kexin KEX2 n=1 Tax=Trichomonascus vanleenenianus TaxID=2268995 RepID=UPI003ECA69ED